MRGLWITAAALRHGDPGIGPCSPGRGSCAHHASGGHDGRAGPAQPAAGVPAARPRPRRHASGSPACWPPAPPGATRRRRAPDLRRSRDRPRRAARRREHLRPRPGGDAGALLVRRRQHPLRHPRGSPGARRSRSRCGCTTCRRARSAARSDRCRTRSWRSGTATRAASTPASRRRRPVSPHRAARPSRRTCAGASGRRPAGGRVVGRLVQQRRPGGDPVGRRHLPARRAGRRRGRDRAVHDDLPGLVPGPDDAHPLQGAPRPEDRAHHAAVLRRQPHREIYRAVPPYTEHTVRDTRNDTDSIYADVGLLTTQRSADGCPRGDQPGPGPLTE